MTDHGKFRRQFTSVMEKLLHNAVSETFKLFDSAVQELNAEIVQVKKNYESLKYSSRLYSDNPHPCLDLGQLSVITTEGNLYKRDVGVQCAGPTLVERSSSPCSQNEDTLQPYDPFPKLSEEEKQCLALVLIKQEECDLDDYSSAFFLLKQEDGEPKLVRRPPIKDIPPEVFISSEVYKTTNKKCLSGRSSTEPATPPPEMDAEEHGSSHSQIQTRSNSEVRNNVCERRPAIEETNIETFPAPGPGSVVEKQTTKSSQDENKTVRISTPNKAPSCTIGPSQAHPVLPLVSEQRFSLTQTADFVVLSSATAKLAVNSSQVASTETTSFTFSTSNGSSTIGPPQSRIHSVMPPHTKPSTWSSLHPPNLAPTSQVSHFPAEFPGLLTELYSNQAAIITNPSTQVIPSPARHTVSRGLVQYQQNQMLMPRQQAPPLQGLPQTTQLPNPQPNISLVSTGQAMFSEGIPRPVYPQLQPASPSLPMSPCLQTVQPQLHPNNWRPLQEKVSTRAINFPQPGIPQGHAGNAGEYNQSRLPFTDMPTPPVAQLASFGNIAASKSPSVNASSMPTPSPCPQAFAGATVNQPGASLTQATQSSVVLSRVPLPPLPPPSQMHTPAVSLQQDPTSAGNLGPPTTDPSSSSASQHMHPGPITHWPSSSPSPPSMPSFSSSGHHASDPLDHMQLINLLHGVPSAAAPATEPSVLADRAPTPSTAHAKPHANSAPVPFQPPPETPQDPLSYPMENLIFTYLNPEDDFEEGSTPTMPHSANTMAEDSLAEPLPSTSSQEYGPLTESVTLPLPPHATPDQPKEGPKDDDDEDDDEESKQQSNLAKTYNTRAKGNKQCEVCGRVLSNATSLAEHARLHTGERPFSCGKCDKAFPTLRGLNRHVQTHVAEKQHRCTECGKTFAYQFTLAKHQRHHTGEKPFQCAMCDKRFFTKSDLVIHIRSHTGEKPFSCTQCNMRFKHRMALNIHMQGHRGEKRFICQVCGKGFLDPGNFKRHSLVHTGEKPFACKVCGKKFSQSAHLKKHASSQH
ncbi:uncharacterized protein LOC134465499 [Engraulis encrasicolus]|uniref:uncharacterized protein LOC134465499 n=1 Tax=Engraulis encrasicolus TaxID=184585 RepID=UPI002FD5CF7C